MTNLCLIVILLSCSNIIILAEPEPLPPGMLYGENFMQDAESLILLGRLKQLAERRREMIEQENELTEEQLAIQARIEAKVREQRVPQNDYLAEEAETLPVPSAIVQQGNGKRGGGGAYMSLCHFKICNMGRKRQS